MKFNMKKIILFLTFCFFNQIVYCTEAKEEKQNSKIDLTDLEKSQDFLVTEARYSSEFDLSNIEFYLRDLNRCEEKVADEKFRKGKIEFDKWIEKYQDELTPKLILNLLEVLGKNSVNNRYNWELRYYKNREHLPNEIIELLPNGNGRLIAIEFFKLVEKYSGYTFEYIIEHWLSGNRFLEVLVWHAIEVHCTSYKIMHKDLYNWARKNNRLSE